MELFLPTSVGREPGFEELKQLLEKARQHAVESCGATEAFFWAGEKVES